MSPTYNEFTYYRKEQSGRSLKLTGVLTTRLQVLQVNLKILDVFSINSFQVSSFMYLYHNDALPISFTQIFQTGNQIHQYSTRYSDYYRPHTCRSNIKKFSILFQGPRIWNSLPIDIKNAPTFSIFKRMIKPSFTRVRQNAT